MAKNHIRWSDPEKKQVMDKYHVLIQAGRSQKVAINEAQQCLPENRHRPFNNNTIWVFNSEYKDAVERKEYSDLPPMDENGNTPLVRETTTERIEWTDDEVEKLAATFIEKRIADPFAPVMHTFEQTQREVLTPDRQRSIAGLAAAPKLKMKIVERWKERTAKVELPPPQIIQIPVPEPVDYIKLSAQLDLPSLFALLANKLGGLLQNTKIQFPETQPQTNGHTPISIIAAASPKPEKKIPRVAFCSVETKVFSELELEVGRHEIGVQLRHVDISSRHAAIPTSCDFVVFMQNALGGMAWKVARDSWPTSRVYTVTAQTMVQKMRDIASMQLPAAHAR